MSTELTQKSLTFGARKALKVVVDSNRFIPVMLKQSKIKKDPMFSMGTQIEGRYLRDQAKGIKKYENWEKRLDERRPLSLRFHANYMVEAKDEKLSRKNIKQWSRPYGNVKKLRPRQIIGRMERASNNRWQIDNNYVWFEKNLK